MFGPRWKLFRLFGIPVRMDASWLFTLLLITWVLASKVFRVALPHLPQLDWWLLGLLTAVAYFTCILLHEMGHALVARSRGIPIRGITLFFLGGVAEMRTEPQSARNEFLLAVAGPAVSLVLAAAFWLLAGYAEAAEWSRSLVVIFGYLAFINLTILLFNLVPAFPLDGGRVLRSMLWGVTGDVRRATYWASLLGQGFSWVLAGAAAFLAVTGDFMGGLFLGLIALFLNDAARSSYRQVLIRQVLAGEPVHRFMDPNPVVVPPTLALRDWVEGYVRRLRRKVFPVAVGGHLEGVISTRALAQYPRDEWDKHTVAEVMRYNLTPVTIPPDADALDALCRMERTGASRLLVADGDRLVGVVSLKDLLRLLHDKLEAEADRAEGAEAQS